MAQRTLIVERPAKSTKATSKKPSANGSQDRERVLEAFRRWGYLQADVDPLGLLKPLKYSELDDLTGAAADEAREIYCGTIGAEFMHLPEPERRQWIAARLESEAPELDQNKILERLVRADLFEQVLQARYLGTKRFSLEGVTALIPLLDSVLNTAGDAGFAGQGIWAETLNLADLKAYTVGGSVHIVVNNLIGFTTPPVQEHSTHFASDIAKRQSVPVFHVNAEDPDAVVRVGQMAAE